MSCAELMYHHQNLSSGFPYHQRSLSDVYYSSYNNPTSAAYNDHNATAAVGSGDSRMLQPLGGEATPATSLLPAAAAPPSIPGLSSTDFSSSASLSSLNRPRHLPPSSSVSPQRSGSGHSASGHSLHSRSSQGGVTNNANTTTPSSSPSLSSPPAPTTLSPTVPFFPPTVASSCSSSSPLSSTSASAFISRPPTHDLSPAVAFPPAPQPSSFFFPPSHQQHYSSSSTSSSFASSSLKRHASDVIDDADDSSVPKRTRYVTSNCVMLTYHDKDTSSEVDDHFSKALSASSPCRYGDDSTPMSQRNLPPSFWDANYQHPHNLYNAYNPYSAFPHPSGTQASYLGHDALYQGLSSGWLGASGALQYPGLSSLQSKDPWSAFPFASAGSAGSGSKSSALTPYYQYSRAMAAGYPDHHHNSLSSGYGPGVGSTRFSSLFPSSSSSTSSPRSGHGFPSATITSAAAAAQCASGDPMGLRMTSLTGELSRNPFAAGSGGGGQF